MSNTAILPARFESGDLIAWLREFNACCAANDWTVNETTDHKILKIPAFLRGQAASHFYTIPEEKRSSYTDAVKELKKAMCPAAHCDNFFAEFEHRLLHPGEDPAVFKWELGEILRKADLSLSEDVRKALLTRQFLRGLPHTLKIKMLEHDPTPTLEGMLQFVQRYRALQQEVGSSDSTVASTVDNSTVASLVAIVKDLSAQQKTLQDQLTRLGAQMEDRERQRQGVRKCFHCGRPGHLARNCRATETLPTASRLQC